jgi:hypothetical protein
MAILDQAQRRSGLGARLATWPRAIYLLAALVAVVHALDLATGLHMMLSYGVRLEFNPLARLVMMSAGPLGVVALKVGGVVACLALLVRAAHLGRARLARDCLLVAGAVGVLGIASNVVG